jgi:hypothetical protein
MKFFNMKRLNRICVIKCLKLEGKEVLKIFLKKYFVWEYLRYQEKRAECFMLSYWYRLTDFEKIYLQSKTHGGMCHFIINDIYFLTYVPL